MQTLIRSMSAKKYIALAAHERCKNTLVSWAFDNRTALARHTLFATRATGNLIQRATGIHVSKMLSGPLGGDQQIGSLIAEGKIDVLIFFWDPLGNFPHSCDVKALLRLATAWNIPIASNETTANFLLQSPLFEQQVRIAIPGEAMS
ncbi:methylglyoxal synthase [Pseudomonas tructae]|uniref:Methylglyoxal synthase n=1 Tax=Pseudomonas tructae TaxID=2518644 RepID=A0A411MHY8_9PSED|nr:methylglyoxal synthase [Pseudomonas tructae]QBF26463.1 methylglyoxal synthase [Pseudomonas tructae]